MTDDPTLAPAHTPPDPNPALTPLAPLVGAWEMALSNAAFLPDPAATAKSLASCAWVQDGAFLEIRMGDPPPRPPAARWLIGRDEATPTYTMLYSDARGVSRVYAMSFAAGVWQIWRDAPGFAQRYAARLSTDGTTIRGHWETSRDGATWEHDFDVTYTKVG